MVSRRHASCARRTTGHATRCSSGVPLTWRRMPLKKTTGTFFAPFFPENVIQQDTIRRALLTAPETRSRLCSFTTQPQKASSTPPDAANKALECKTQPHSTADKEYKINSITPHTEGLEVLPQWPGLNITTMPSPSPRSYMRDPQHLRHHLGIRSGTPTWPPLPQTRGDDVAPCVRYRS
ncbi:hypothetical protein E2C01_013223 [Portunus trituberculatus]|uniref:Uncharacterized protein n=1 Tax=Portunus trituberculatus TaxID=210409 RepID=A0A5B7DGJ0_PORTR|nr:hypothetical protein [Portunus trituberculatus]